MHKIILFDGECNLCDASVQFILKRDSNHVFHFASLQSNIGQRLMKQYNVPLNTNSIILLDREHYDTESTAALKIARQLRGGWRLFYVAMLLPRPLRDVLYKWIAKNRYRWFGKKQTCLLPSIQQRNQFLIDQDL